jgi:transmembrane sensor
MSRRKARKLHNPILEEACTWFVEINENAQDKATREAFNQWLRASPEHVRAYLQVAAHWEEGAGRRALESIDDLVALGRSEKNVVPLMRDVDDGLFTLKSRSSPRQRRGIKLIALAASILVTLFAGTLAWKQWFSGVYGTGIGEQRSITLVDGSTVELNSRTRIKVRYSSAERRIDLLQGQALFQVAKNPTRPFIVQTGSTKVRAVGTQFDVYRKVAGTVVTVIEGRVAVGDAQAAREAGDGTATAMRVPAVGAPAVAIDEILLAAGEQLTMTATAIATKQTANVAAATAWTQRRLVFSSAPLAEVVEEFNRYNAIPLVIADPTLADTQISGSFSSTDPSSLLRFLREIGTYDVRETGASIQISRK